MFKDPFRSPTREFVEDPFPTYAAIRKISPIVKSPETGNWIITGYDTVMRALREGSLCSRLPEDISTETTAVMRNMQENWIVRTDGREHAELRILLKECFDSQYHSGLKTSLNEAAAKLVAELDGQKEIEFMSSVALKIPTITLIDSLALPPGDFPLIHRWSLTFYSHVPPLDQQGINPISEATSELLEYLDEIIRSREKSLRTDSADLLSRLLEKRGSITRQQIRDNCAFLFFAGHETVAHLLGNFMHAILVDRQNFESLREDREILKSAFDEILRYDGPIQWLPRFAAKDFTIDSENFKEGDFIHVVIAAANRDPSKFENPDNFDIDRKNSKHAAFGFGMHSCLGAQQTRIQFDTVVNQMLDKFPTLTLKGEKLWHNPCIAVRGFKSLPLMVG